MTNHVVEHHERLAEVFFVCLGELRLARIGAKCPVRVFDQLLPLRVEGLAAVFALKQHRGLLLF